MVIDVEPNNIMDTGWLDLTHEGSKYKKCEILTKRLEK